MIGPVEAVRGYTFLLERFDNSHPADILNNLICHLIDTFLPNREFLRLWRSISCNPAVEIATANSAAPPKKGEKHSSHIIVIARNM